MDTSLLITSETVDYCLVCVCTLIFYAPSLFTYLSRMQSNSKLQFRGIVTKMMDQHRDERVHLGQTFTCEFCHDHRMFLISNG